MTAEPWVPVPPPENEGDTVPNHTRPARTTLVQCVDCGTRFNPADRICPWCGRLTMPTDRRGLLVEKDGDDSAGTAEHNRRID